MPIDPLTAATLVSGGIGLADKIFGGGAQKRARKRLEEQAERGLDPKILQRALSILRKRTANDVSGTIGRLQAGGIDPRSGLATETAGAVRNRAGAEAGELSSLFEFESARAQDAANRALAGQEDESTSDLIQSLVLNLGTAKYGQGKGAAQQPISLLDPSQIKMRGLDRLKPKPLPTRLDYLR